MNIPYIRSGDYFIPDLKLPEETRSLLQRCVPHKFASVSYLR